MDTLWEPRSSSSEKGFGKLGGKSESCCVELPAFQLIRTPEFHFVRENNWPEGSEIVQNEERKYPA